MGSMCTCIYWYLQSPGAFQSFGSGVAGGCEFPSVGAGNGTLVHDKKTMQTASALCGKNCGGRQWL